MYITTTQSVTQSLGNRKAIHYYTIITFRFYFTASSLFPPSIS